MEKRRKRRRVLVDREQLVGYLDRFFRVAEIEDASDNGLQVEGTEEIRTVAFAVDACQQAFHRAAQAGAQMLVTHHGLFWGKSLMVTGIHRERLSFLVQHQLSLYSVHLPLDVHPEVGNNVRLARLLGLEPGGRFGDYHGVLLGVMGTFSSAVSRDELVNRLEENLGAAMTVLPYGPDTIKTVGIISGGAASMADQAAAAGVDLFLTGEASHSVFHQIVERGMNVVYGGHYATETLGLKALAGHLSEQFDILTTFLDIPTGF
jgi:dinuclear metal center YbgI/SA1388 family protein